ncbi:MAG: T9SS type A sorting domain-containing protein [Salinibacter sp.]|uniref:T9SS type A sorting domain-containing protein n=1 Tax=Salinibacter sp. TaxID=2065818 RepID=UPI0035D44A46
MDTLYKYCIGTLVLFSLTIHPLQAQPDDVGNRCDVGESVTKIETENVDGSSFTKDGITIDNFQTKDGGEIIGGDWSRASGTIDRVQVKIGGGADVTADANYNPSAGNGEFSNSASGGSFNDPDPDLTAVSNIRFCEVDPECDTPTLALSGEDQVTAGRDGVSNTIQDSDGIDEFTFTTLDGFEVDKVGPSSGPTLSGFTRSGNTWEWTGSGSRPTSVDFTLDATKSTATYFVKIFDNCDAGRKMNEVDPRFELLSGAAQPTLAGSAPNPFSGQTTVKFALPEQTRVTVSVYDMMGRKVATLVDGSRRAGTHRVSWSGQSDDGQALASGVYLLRMRADGQSKTRRVTIVR